jgi:hypothetical protein
MWMRVKRVIYRMGFRPQLGSIFHSPSLNFLYTFKEYVTYDRH